MKRFLYYTMFVLSVGVAGYAFLFFALGLNPHLLGRFTDYMPFAYAHVYAGAVAMLLGPIQFHQGFRSRFLTVHRFIGRTYLTAILVASIGGAYLAVFSDGGIVAHVGFGTLAVLWFATSFNALRHIKRGDVQTHRKWMMRSFALTLAAVTLRIWLPLGLVAGYEFEVIYPIISWLCWVPNLMIVEIMVRRTTTPQRAQPAAA